MAQAKVYNVLVFPAGTEVAFEIHHALRYSKFVRLFGATSVDCHADMLFKDCQGGLPYAGDDALIASLNQLTERWDIDYIYPAHDSAALALVRAQAQLKATVVSSPLETMEVCRSKNRTYQHLAGADYLPRCYDQPQDISAFPIFAKPSVGQGSQGVCLVNDRRELDELLSSGTEYALCEYLPGQEITVDCFTDRHGQLRYIGPRSRERIRAGIAVRSRLLPPDPWVEHIARDIAARLDFNGVWFFQLKKDSSGLYKLLEIGPRIAGTMGLSRARGVNMPLLSLYNLWGYDVDLLIQDAELLVDRAFISRFKHDYDYDRVYIDLDDTLILRSQVVPSMMAFLYQCRDQGKKLILLSKHRGGDVEGYLLQHCICPQLFHQIVHLGKNDSKSDYIQGRAIFIDDSFAERRQVQQRLGIPVFDLDMVESLLDWRG